MSDARQWRTAANIAGVRALVNHDRGQRVEILGSYDEYRFDETSMGVDDGDLILKPSNLHASLPGRWIRIQQEKKDLDAAFAATFIVSSDGKGDYTNLADAIAALPATGGTIFVHAGTYSISSALAIPNKNIRIIGASNGKSAAIVSNGTIIDLGSNAISVFELATGARPLIVENIGFKGDGTAGQRIAHPPDFPDDRPAIFRNVISQGIEKLFGGNSRIMQELEIYDSTFTLPNNNTAQYFEGQVGAILVRCAFNKGAAASPSVKIFGDTPNIKARDCSFGVNDRSNSFTGHLVRCQLSGGGSNSILDLPDQTYIIDCEITGTELSINAPSRFVIENLVHTSNGNARAIDVGTSLTGAGTLFIRASKFDSYTSEVLRSASTNPIDLVDCGTIKITMTGSADYLNLVRTKAAAASTFLGNNTRIDGDHSYAGEYTGPTIQESSNATLSIGTEDFDTDGIGAPAASPLTVPAGLGGKWEFNAAINVYPENSALQTEIQLLVDGSPVAYFYAILTAGAGSPYICVPIHKLLALNPAQYVEVKVVNNHVTDDVTVYYNKFSFKKVA